MDLSGLMSNHWSKQMYDTYEPIILHLFIVDNSSDILTGIPNFTFQE